WRLAILNAGGSRWPAIDGVITGRDLAAYAARFGLNRTEPAGHAPLFGLQALHRRPQRRLIATGPIPLGSGLTRGEEQWIERKKLRSSPRSSRHSPARARLSSLTRPVCRCLTSKSCVCR